MTPCFYEDFPLGQRLQSQPFRMTKEAIIVFARDFDPQPQHTDEAAARTSVFGTLVASGWHTASVSMRLQLEAGLNRIPGGTMGAQIDKLIFRRPVLPGDLIRTTVEVLERRESRSKPKLGLLTLRTTTVNQHDDLVLEMTSTIFAPKRP